MEKIKVYYWFKTLSFTYNDGQEDRDDREDIEDWVQESTRERVERDRSRLIGGCLRTIARGCFITNLWKDLRR